LIKDIDCLILPFGDRIFVSKVTSLELHTMQIFAISEKDNLNFGRAHNNNPIELIEMSVSLRFLFW